MGEMVYRPLNGKTPPGHKTVTVKHVVVEPKPEPLKVKVKLLEVEPKPLTVMVEHTKAESKLSGKRP